MDEAERSVRIAALLTDCIEEVLVLDAVTAARDVWSNTHKAPEPRSIYATVDAYLAYERDLGQYKRRFQELASRVDAQRVRVRELAQNWQNLQLPAMTWFRQDGWAIGLASSDWADVRPWIEITPWREDLTLEKLDRSHRGD